MGRSLPAPHAVLVSCRHSWIPSRRQRQQQQQQQQQQSNPNRAPPESPMRFGLAKAKEYALTGKPLTGIEASEIELINKAVSEGVPAAVAERDGPFGDYSQRKKQPR
jgi:hypothetical protein